MGWCRFLSSYFPLCLRIFSDTYSCSHSFFFSLSHLFSLSYCFLALQDLTNLRGCSCYLSLLLSVCLTVRIFPTLSFFPPLLFLSSLSALYKSTSSHSILIHPTSTILSFICFWFGKGVSVLWETTGPFHTLLFYVFLSFIQEFDVCGFVLTLNLTMPHPTWQSPDPLATSICTDLTPSPYLPWP